MYFTDTPALNSMETIMKRPPYSTQKGGGRQQSAYRYTKQDCDCRFCLHHRKRNGCTMTVCPVLDARLSCGAASVNEAIASAFTGVSHLPLQRRLSKIYVRKDEVPMLFSNDRHRQAFEAQRQRLRRPDKEALAVLYLLTADKNLWQKTKPFLSGGTLDWKRVRLGEISADAYALWKAAKELQTGEKQISLCELADSGIVSDNAFRLIVQAVTIARFGAAVLSDI